MVEQGRPLTRAQLLDRLIAKTIKILEENSALLALPPTVVTAKNGLLKYQAASTLEEKQRLFASVVRSMWTDTKRRLVLFIDNVDYVYHLNDRTMFSADDHIFIEKSGWHVVAQGR